MIHSANIVCACVCALWELGILQQKRQDCALMKYVSETSGTKQNTYLTKYIGMRSVLRVGKGRWMWLIQGWRGQEGL